MIAQCPHCKADVEVGVVHHGIGNDGRQRMTIEAQHSPVAEEGGAPRVACLDWMAKQVNLEQLVSRS